MLGARASPALSANVWPGAQASSLHSAYADKMSALLSNQFA